MSITIGEYLLARLAGIGIRHILGVPGDFNLWFLEQAAQTQVKFIGCSNELNAAYAADGYARVAGISVLATTYGVGELASLAGVAGAFAERVPIVCITGAPPLSAIRSKALLHHTLADGNYGNMMSCFREFTVAQALIEPATAMEEIDRVLQSCLNHKRPVYLQLPSDVAGVRIEQTPTPSTFEPPASDAQELAEAVSRVAARIARANSPVLLLDADAGRFNLIRLLEKLAELNDIPVAHLLPAKGMFRQSHPLFIGIYRGAPSDSTVRQLVEGSDCLICIGPRFTDVATAFFSHTLTPLSMIEVQPFPLTIGGERFAAVSAADFLETLTKGRIRQSNSLIPPRAIPGGQSGVETNNGLTQDVFWRRIQAYLRPGDVMVSDTGTSFFGSVNLDLPEDVVFLGQPIWGALGYGLPATLGSCLAVSDRRQLLFVGDGGFQMAVQELSTILRWNLTPVIFLINNDGYTIERLILGPESSFNDISAWHYAEFPRVFDRPDRVQVYRVTDESTLETALLSTADKTKAHLVELIFDRLDAPKGLSRFARLAAEFDYPEIRE